LRRKTVKVRGGRLVWKRGVHGRPIPRVDNIAMAMLGVRRLRDGLTILLSDQREPSQREDPASFGRNVSNASGVLCSVRCFRPGQTKTRQRPNVTETRDKPDLIEKGDPLCLKRACGGRWRLVFRAPRHTQSIHREQEKAGPVSLEPGLLWCCRTPGACASTIHRSIRSFL
jgi:hypothetical protein